jgi:hypothetical protein
MKVLLLELIGLVCFVVAGWLVTPALGFAVIGVAALVSAWSLARISTKDDGK